MIRMIIPFVIIVLIAHILVRTPVYVTHEPAAPQATGHRTEQPEIPVPYSFREFMDALVHVESGGDLRAIGDNGTRRGPYQICRSYWIDGGGTDYDSGVWDKRASESVMLRYWARYCPGALHALEYSTLARVHNGGPRGDSKESTIGYWNKVRARMLAGRNKESQR